MLRDIRERRWAKGKYFDSAFGRSEVKSTERWTRKRMGPLDAHDICGCACNCTQALLTDTCGTKDLHASTTNHVSLRRQMETLAPFDDAVGHTELAKQNRAGKPNGSCADDENFGARHIHSNTTKDALVSCMFIFSPC
jgi:hypothetical protein